MKQYVSYFVSYYWFLPGLPSQELSKGNSKRLQDESVYNMSSFDS